MEENLTIFDSTVGPKGMSCMSDLPPTSLSDSEFSIAGRIAESAFRVRTGDCMLSRNAHSDRTLMRDLVGSDQSINSGIHQNICTNGLAVSLPRVVVLSVLAFYRSLVGIFDCTPVASIILDRVAAFTMSLTFPVPLVLPSSTASPRIL